MQTPPPLPPMRSAPPPPQAAPVAASSGASMSRDSSGGHGRLRQMVAMLAGGGMAITLGIGGLQMVAKPGFRPSDVIASIEAQVARETFVQLNAEEDGDKPGTKRLTEAQYKELIAESERKGAAKAELAYQRKLAVVQADKERVVAAYQTLFQRANMIAQAALQLETIAQQFRQQLLSMSNGGRNMVIMFKDIFCGLGNPEACASARDDRGTMIAEADELSRGDVGNKVRELMAGVDDPASFITHEDQRQRGMPVMDADN